MEDGSKWYQDKQNRMAINLEAIDFAQTVYDQHGKFKFFSVMVNGQMANYPERDEAELLAKAVNEFHGTNLEVREEIEIPKIITPPNSGKVVRPRLKLMQPPETPKKNG